MAVSTFTRQLGVFGYTLPPLVGNTIQPADFGIAGVMGRFRRQIAGVVQVNNVADLSLIGGDYQSGKYGRYVLDTFFANLKGQPARLYVKPFVPSNAVQASLVLNDASAASTITVKAGYQGKADKSADGNSTGVQVIPATASAGRFATTASASAILGATTISLTQVGGIVVGDVLNILSTAVVHYAKVTAVNESAGTVTVSATTRAIVQNDPVFVMCFKIQCYRQNSRGITSLYSTPENNIWLSLEAETGAFYIGNAFANHPYLTLTNNNSVSGMGLKYPVAVSTTTFLASGADGTAPATASDWSGEYANFDTLPIRFLFNTDTTLTTVNVAGEAYCGARSDAPIWLYNIASQQSYSSLITLGNTFQRSDIVNGVICASWRNVADPLSNQPNGYLEIPTNGAICGAWIRTFYTLGFHRSPAGYDVPLAGFIDTPLATEDTFTEQQRTDIANAGINLIQKVAGAGLIVRTFITPSTNVGGLFGKFLIMTNFIKVSAVQSLANTESRPNKITTLKDYGEIIRDFGRKLYKGSYPFGIDRDGAFGAFIKQDGTLSTLDDVFTVDASQFVNPQSSINIGQGNIIVRYYGASDLTSLAIGVGVSIPLG